MFGFNKKQPMIEGPIEFEMAIEIDRPAEDVFKLIDFSDPAFAPKHRGATVTQLPGSDDRFTMVLAEMEDVQFNFHMTERVPSHRHVAACTMEPQVGELVSAIEEHTIEAISATSCRVVQITKATFGPHLSDEQIAGEVAMMSVAVQSDLTKLKIHAEEGPEAVAAFEEEMYGDFELDGFEIDLEGLDLDLDDIEFGEHE